MASSIPKSTRSREQILNDFQGITGINIEDAIHFLDLYDWKLEDITNDYWDGVEFKRNLPHDPKLGRFYTAPRSDEPVDENDERQYTQRSSKNDNEDRSANSSYQQQEGRHSREVIPAERIYHEKQRFMRCGLHSLNNLFQIPKLFTHQNLDSIAREYDKRLLFNDYVDLVIGNYDLRVLIEAIHRVGFQVRQINVYNDYLPSLPWDSYFGLLINLNRRHWFTIKNLNGIYYNLDSTLRKPKEIGQKPDMISYLYRLTERNRVYLFAVLQEQQMDRTTSLPRVHSF